MQNKNGFSSSIGKAKREENGTKRAHNNHITCALQIACAFEEVKPNVEEKYQASFAINAGRIYLWRNYHAAILRKNICDEKLFKKCI